MVAVMVGSGGYVNVRTSSKFSPQSNGGHLAYNREELQGGSASAPQSVVALLAPPPHSQHHPSHHHAGGATTGGTTGRRKRQKNNLSYSVMEKGGDMRGEGSHASSLSPQGASVPLSPSSPFYDNPTSPTR